MHNLEQMNKMRKLCSFIFFLLLGIPYLYIAQEDSCSDSLHSVVVNPDADVFIGISSCFRIFIGDGYGCSDYIYDMAHSSYEAGLWAMNILNQEEGLIFGNFIVDSFIPGVKIGLKVFDDCMRPDIAVRNVVEMIPKISISRRFNEMCSAKNSYFLGIVGSCESLTTKVIAAISSVYQIPQINIFSSFIENSNNKFPYLLQTSPFWEFSQVALGCLLLAKMLNWTKVIFVIEGQQEWTSPMLKNALDSATRLGICAGLVINIPTAASSAINDKTIQQIVAHVPNTVAVISLFNTKFGLDLLLQSASRNPSSKYLHWIIFDNSLKPVLLKHASLMVGSIIINYDNQMPSSLINFIKSKDALLQQADNPWFQLYFMNNNMCRLPGVSFEPYVYYPLCQSFHFEHNGHINLNSYAKDLITTIYIFSAAFKNAWLDLCNQRGLCPMLLNLTSQDFFIKYLSGMHFTHSQEMRSPPEFWNHSISFDTEGMARKSPIGLYSFENLQKTSRGFHFMEVYKFDGNQLQIKAPIQFYDVNGKSYFEPRISSCFSQNCWKDGCITSSMIQMTKRKNT